MKNNIAKYKKIIVILMLLLLILTSLYFYFSGIKQPDYYLEARLYKKTHDIIHVKAVMNYASWKDQSDPDQWAPRSERYQGGQALLGTMLDPNEKGKTDVTALNVLFKEGVSVLDGAGGVASGFSTDGKTPLSVNNSTSYECFSPLSRAIQKRYSTEVIDCLIIQQKKEQEQAKSKFSPFNGIGQTHDNILTWSLTYNRPDVVLMVCKKYKSDIAGIIDRPGFAKKTALQMAEEKNLTDIVFALHEAGAKK
jgi:hypothetical protein